MGGRGQHTRVADTVVAGATMVVDATFVVGATVLADATTFAGCLPNRVAVVSAFSDCL